MKLNTLVCIIDTRILIYEYLKFNGHVYLFVF